MVKSRTAITNKKKKDILLVVQSRLAEGHSIRSICTGLSIQPSQYRRWKKSEERLRAANPKARSLSYGGRSDLEEMENDLLIWIFELREQGMAVSIGMIAMKACELDRDFRNRTEHARYQCARRFTIAHRFAVQIKTHESQRPLAEVAEEARSFVESMKPIVSEARRDKRWIINMDQTPVFFSMTPNTSLDQVGARTINVRTSSGSTIRVTLAVTVTASGTTLPPLMVFKGKPNGRIQRAFGTYPVGCFYAVQERAWMDERVMLMWVELVLIPYVETAPPGIIPLLFLDSYRCHMMASVVTKINDLGVEVVHIPGGCTSLCQPVDVGVNKPFKNKVRGFWQTWMLDTGVMVALTTPPTRERVAQWCIDGLRHISEEIIQHSWTHGEYSYFD